MSGEKCLLGLNYDCKKGYRQEDDMKVWVIEVKSDNDWRPYSLYFYDKRGEARCKMEELSFYYLDNKFRVKEYRRVEE